MDEDIDDEDNIIDILPDNYKLLKLVKGGNVNQWLTLLEMMRTMNRWGDDTTKMVMLGAIDSKLIGQIPGIVWFGANATPLEVIKRRIRESIGEDLAENCRMKLENRKIKKDETVQDYGKDIVRLARTINANIDYDTLSFYFINGLPRKFHAQVNGLRYVTNDIMVLIRASQACIERDSHFEKKSQRNFNEKSRKKSLLKCYRCGKIGHKKVDCKVKLDGEVRNKKVRLLVDTGSDNSFISRKIVSNNNLKPTKCNFKAVGFNGAVSSISERVVVDNNGVNETFFVSENDDDDVIIGMDILSKNEDGKAAIKFLKKVKKSYKEKFSKKEKVISKKIFPEKETLNLEEIPKEEIPILDISPTEAKLGNTSVDDTLLKLDDLNEEEKVKARNLINEFIDIFGNDITVKESLQEVTHKIELKNSIAIAHKPYNMAYSERGELRKQLSELEHNGLIRRSTSPYAAPVLFVKKKDGTKRLVIDYRKLNEITLKDPYPMMMHEDIFSSLNGSKFFSSLDFTAGYWQVLMEETDVMKTAFITCFGKFEWLRMPFGLTNAPSTFQRFMDQMIINENIGDFTKAKLDDLLVHSTSDFDDHLRKLKEVFTIIRKYGGKLKMKKCALFRKSLSHLGMVINEEGVKPDTAHIAAIQRIGELKSKKDIQKFLGTMNYYRSFIKNFAQIAKPLTDMLRKNIEFNWGEEQKIAFEKLKNLLVNSPILVYPNFDEEFILQTDASINGIGCALFQSRGTIRHPIAFYSRTLSKHERNYSISALEALALVFAAKKCRHYVYQNDKVIIETDHKALQYIKTWKGENSTIARWWIRITEAFDKAKIVYISGAKNITADFLSRVFKIKLKDIIKEQKNDEEYNILLEKTKENKKFTQEDGVVYFKKRIFIPKNFRIPMLMLTHDDNCHVGINKVIQLLTQYCYWPGMNGFISRWIKTCEVCQRQKIDRQKKFNYVGKHENGYPWQKIHIDFVGPFKRSDAGNKYILTIIDHFSKYAEAYPVIAADGVSTAKILEDEIFFRYGFPEIVYSDRGTHFLNEKIETLFDNYNIKHKYTTAFNPQSNGICERFNATIVEMLRSNINFDQINWDIMIRKCLFTYNSTVQNTTKCTPYELLFGFGPKTQLEKLMIKSQEEDIAHFIKKKFSNVKELFEKEEEREEKNVKHNFSLNDLVLIKEHKQVGNIDEQSKFISKFKGPYKIIQFPNNYTAKLLDEKNGLVDVVHLKYVKKYYLPTENEFGVPNNDLQQLRYPVTDIVTEDVDDEEDGRDPNFSTSTFPDTDENLATPIDDETPVRRSSRNTRRPVKYGSTYWDHISSDNSLSEPVTGSVGDDVIRTSTQRGRVDR